AAVFRPSRAPRRGHARRLRRARLRAVRARRAVADGDLGARSRGFRHRQAGQAAARQIRRLDHRRAGRGEGQDLPRRAPRLLRHLRHPHQRRRHRDGARGPRREDFARRRHRRGAGGLARQRLTLRPPPDDAPAALLTISSVEDPALQPGTVVGEYVIERKLGDGGMATVYGATHPLIGKKAAIKVMSPSLSADASAVARFALEARAINAIGHPNLVDVFSFGRLPDGRSYFVMEWLPGETLYEHMWKQHGPLPLDEVINILDQICDALEATHDKGIIHRDLKPANVFLCPVRGRRDVVKLLDFGVAKLAHQESNPRWTSA